MATPLINPTTLDVDGIKTSLKNFLKSQAEFSDYNFDGSGLNVLLNILAANTHYYALYKAMVANEAFLDSAILRSSIISRANERGYLPGGIKASSSTITATLTGAGAGQASVPVPKGTVFLGVVDNKTYYFVTSDQEDLLPTGAVGAYSGSFVVREGQYVTTTFDYTLNGRYIIPNLNVDPSTIRVRVQVSRQNASAEVFHPVTSIVSVTGTDPAYFITETDAGNYELVFGNGTFGKSLSVGNVIVVDYIVSTAGEGNGIATLSPATPIFQVGTLAMTNTPTAGATLAESTASIKENTKRHLPQQNRCVTSTDYATEVRRQFPEYLDVISWGGEDNQPPILGKTFISVLSPDLLPLTQSKKREIIAACKLKNVTGITPEVVDVNLTYVRLNVLVKYDSKLTSHTTNTLRNSVRNLISTYNSEKLLKFGSDFVDSQLVTKIGDAEPSIISTKIVATLESTIFPDLVNPSSYEFSFATAIKPGSLTSEPFLIQNAERATVYRVADFDGRVVVKAFPTGKTPYQIPGFWGTVNYASGRVTLGNLLIQPTINKDGWTALADPIDQDIFTSGNHVVAINLTNTVVNPQAIKQ